MAHLPIDFCKRVATARRAKGLTQSALARSAGCAQSAISMFESGRPEKLSMEFVRKVAEILEIPLEKKGEENHETPIIPLLQKKGYCPNAACLSNIPFQINDELVIWPAISSMYEGSRYCKTCGEVLETGCPECGRDVEAGAFCTGCGTARVTAILPTGSAPERWIAERRDEIREFRELVSANKTGPQ